MGVREKLMELPIDDAILILKEEHKQRTDGYTTHLAHGGKGDPAEEVNLDALAMAISALEQTKWISVKNGLPKDRDWVLVNHTGYATPKKAKYKDDFSPHLPVFLIDGDNGNKGEVTHWMPLPQPPKGE